MAYWGFKKATFYHTSGFLIISLWCNHKTTPTLIWSFIRSRLPQLPALFQWCRICRWSSWLRRSPWGPRTEPSCTRWGWSPKKTHLLFAFFAQNATWRLFWAPDGATCVYSLVPDVHVEELVQVLVVAADLQVVVPPHHTLRRMQLQWLQGLWLGFGENWASYGKVSLFGLWELRATYRANTYSRLSTVSQS